MCECAPAVNFHPIDSQRLVLWAARFGKQEEFVEIISTNHFGKCSRSLCVFLRSLKVSGCTEKRASVNEQTALLSAVQDVGLDVEAAVEMLESEELEEDVWDSYRHLQQSGLEAIPLWVFTVRHEIPKPDGEPGELFPVVKPYVVSGSSTSATFEKVFETIADDAEAAAELREAQQTPKL